VAGKGSPSFCVCNRGFSLNPTSGRCEVSACVRSVSDAWDVTIPVPHDDCQSRAISACGGLDVGADGALQNEVYRLARNGCMLPTFTWLRVVTDDGCPTELRLRTTGGTSSPGLGGCLAKALSAVRWDCGRPSGCALVENDTLP
jgi:hypothetical protein